MMNKDETFLLNRGVRQIKLTLKWESTNKMIAFSLFRYDYKARTIESLRSESWEITDGFFDLSPSGLHQRLFVDLSRADDTHAFIITVDGFENFNTDDDVVVECSDCTEYSNFGHLFTIRTQMYSSFKGLCVCCFYIDGVFFDSRSRWVVKTLQDPMFAYSIPEQETYCSQRVVNIVPSFERFRYHLFTNVRSVCAALSSQSLPKLKDKFLKHPQGVSKSLFTDLIFNNLHENHPKIIEPEEAVFSISLIHELFDSIDYSGDEFVSWEEFTSFVITTIVGMIQTDPSGGSSSSSDEYTVEYEEDVTARDRTLSPHIPVQSMKFISETNLVLVVPEKSSVIYIFHCRNFQLRSKIDPSLLTDSTIRSSDYSDNRKGAGVEPKSRLSIYDVVYMTGRDLYCFSADDNSITAVKEVVILGGKRVTYNQMHRLLHTLNHPLLCWSHSSQVLVSISTSNTLYGWDLQAGQPMYQSARHSQVITSIIAINSMDVFATSSMDKTILFQAASTGRVKGILKGHTRGVKCIDANSFYLLSGSFDGEAKLWALDSKAVIMRLQGHRSFIVAVKLMCEKAHSDSEHRAVTVDDSGEFRLWNVGLSERFVDPPVRTATQVFGMYAPQMPMNKIKFLALGYDMQKKSSSYYASVYAIGSKLLHFKAKKSAKDFLTPSCCAYNAPFGVVLVAFGRSVAEYDIATGRMLGVIKDLSSSDITALCLDVRNQGRTYYVGDNGGFLASINFRAKAVITSTQASSSEVSCIGLLPGTDNFIVIGCHDGSAAVVRDTGEHLVVTAWRLNDCFGGGMAVNKLAVCVTSWCSLVVCISNKAKWCIWNTTQGLATAIGEEKSNLTAVELVGTSTRSLSEDEDHAERLITFAIGSSSAIYIYTMDMLESKCFCSLSLNSDSPAYINSFTILHLGPSAINYSNPYGAKTVVVGFTDDGQVMAWDCDQLHEEAETKYRNRTLKTPSRLKRGRRYSVLKLFHEEEPGNYTEEVVSHAVWRAHLDGISTFTTVEYYGLVITVSSDGFARVWNLDQDCLGEVTIPNISDDMKDNRLQCVKNGLWNLIMERKAFSEEEQAEAARLVETVRLRGQIGHFSHDGNDFALDSHSIDSNDSLSPSIIRITDILAQLNQSDNARNRITQLSSLVEAPPSITDTLLLHTSSLDSISLASSVVSHKSLSSYMAKAGTLADLSFGSQTSYYKNAELIINASKKHSAEKAKHLLEMAGIDRKIKAVKMAKSRLEPIGDLASQKLSLFDEQSINDKLRKEEELSNIRLYKSSLLVPPDAPRRPLDLEYLKKKADSFSEELAADLKRDLTKAEYKMQQKMRRRAQESFDERTALEKKLQNAIMFVLDAPKGKDIGPRKKLRTRDLLPSYTVQDVHNFIAMINKADADFSGSLDIHEWVSLFTSMGSALQAHQAISMFDGAETKSGGKLYISDLVPMIFPKANKHQRKLIIDFTESEIFAAKSMTTNIPVNKEPLTVYDMERLFETYDTKLVGFIPLKFVRERLNQIDLPIHVLVEVTQDLYSDDYVSIVEFLKIFRLFIQDKFAKEQDLN